jgi:hypothetical protein
VKPVELMKWLVALVCPKNGTCLDPFAGSVTTGVAALATVRNAILIEGDPAQLELDPDAGKPPLLAGIPQSEACKDKLDDA